MKILIIDDDPLICRALRRVIPQTIDVISCTDGNHALDTFDAEHPDCVVCDLLMPNVLGSELLREMKARSPTTRCVLLTGAPSVDDPGSVDAVLFKPWEHDLFEKLGLAR